VERHVVQHDGLREQRDVVGDRGRGGLDVAAAPVVADLLARRACELRAAGRVAWWPARSPLADWLESTGARCLYVTDGGRVGGSLVEPSRIEAPPHSSRCDSRPFAERALDFQGTSHALTGVKPGPEPSDSRVTQAPFDAKRCPRPRLNCG
jgi:hypothetical protein